VKIILRLASVPLGKGASRSRPDFASGATALRSLGPRVFFCVRPACRMRAFALLKTNFDPHLSSNCVFGWLSSFSPPAPLLFLAHSPFPICDIALVSVSLTLYLPCRPSLRGRNLSSDLLWICVFACFPLARRTPCREFWQFASWIITVHLATRS